MEYMEFICVEYMEQKEEMEYIYVEYMEYVNTYTDLLMIVKSSLHKMPNNEGSFFRYCPCPPNDKSGLPLKNRGTYDL